MADLEGEHMRPRCYLPLIDNFIRLKNGINSLLTAKS